MHTIAVDPVTAALLTATRGCDCPGAMGEWPDGSCNGRVPLLSFVTVDHPPPDGWIGQRVAIYAGSDWGCVHPVAWERAKANGQKIVTDAIAGSGTLAEARPTVEFNIWDERNGQDRIIIMDPDGDREVWLTERRGHPTRLIHQERLQDWSPGRWALRFTDVAPISERCPTCGLLFGAWLENYCPTCGGAGAVAPIPAPVLSGDDPTYKEWTP